MSIIGDMKPIMLQERKSIRTNSGASKYEWVDVKFIDVALYLTDDMKNTQSIRYNQSTNTAITFYKEIDKDNNRLIDGDNIYTINKLNTRGRLTTMLLQGVNTNV